MNKKVVLMRSLLVVVYLLLLVVTFVFGRTHTLLIDNKSASDVSVALIFTILELLFQNIN